MTDLEEFRETHRVWSTNNARAMTAMNRDLKALREQNETLVQQLADIGQLWDYRTNQGFPFLNQLKDVRIMRALLAGERLADQPGFECLAEEEEIND